MLTCGDKVYTQSTAVARVAARKAGLMPTDEEELYQVDNLIAAVEDLKSLGYQAMPQFGATEEAVQKYIKEQLPLHLGNFNRILGEQEWFVGSKMTMADVYVYDLFSSQCTALVPDSLNDFPKLQALFKRV